MQGGNYKQDTWTSATVGSVKTGSFTWTGINSWTDSTVTYVDVRNAIVSCTINWNNKYEAKNWSVCDTGDFYIDGGANHVHSAAYNPTPDLRDDGASEFTVTYSCKIVANEDDGAADTECSSTSSASSPFTTYFPVYVPSSGGNVGTEEIVYLATGSSAAVTATAATAFMPK